MDRQPKLRPQQPNLTFANGRSSQEPVAGTVARGDHYENNAINTGREPGTTNFVAAIPVPSPKHSWRAASSATTFIACLATARRVTATAS